MPSLGGSDQESHTNRNPRAGSDRPGPTAEATMKRWHYFLVAVLLMAPAVAQAQTTQVSNLTAYDNQGVYFGGSESSIDTVAQRFVTGAHQLVRHVTIFEHGHGLQRAIIDESQHRTPERLIMAQH